MNFFCFLTHFMLIKVQQAFFFSLFSHFYCFIIFVQLFQNVFDALKFLRHNLNILIQPFFMSFTLKVYLYILFIYYLCWFLHHISFKSIYFSNLYPYPCLLIMNFEEYCYSNLINTLHSLNFLLLYVFNSFNLKMIY